MEMLAVLEEKIKNLVDLVASLKSENSELKSECKSMQEQIESLQTTALKDKSHISQEKELTKVVVDGLIESIDALVDSDN